MKFACDGNVSATESEYTVTINIRDLAAKMNTSLMLIFSSINVIDHSKCKVLCKYSN